MFDVIVAGAGLAGSTAARNLSDRGASVALLEASNRVGGRTLSRPFAGRSEIIECGGAWMNPDLHPLLYAEVQRYGIELIDDNGDSGTKRFFTGGRLRRWPIPMTQIFRLLSVLSWAQKASRQFTVAGSLHEQPVRALDVSAREFLAPLKLPSATRDFYYAFLAAFSGTHPDELSMLSPVSKVAAFGYSPYGLYSGQAPGSSPGKMFASGSNEVAKAMVRTSSLELRLASPIVEIDQSSDSVCVTVSSGESFRGRYAIIAIPSNVLKRIRFSPELSPEKREIISRDHVGKAYKVHMIAKGVPSWPVALGMAPFQMILPSRDLGSGQWMLTGFGCQGVSAMDPLNISDVQHALRQYFPDSEVLAVDGHDWTQDPFHLGTYRMDRPGEAYDMPRIMNTPEGRVVFAGGDIDDSIWRVSMEGAVHSGHQASATVLAQLKPQSP